MKIIAGVHQPDSGTILHNGAAVRFPTPQDALRAGITLIHQEPLSFPDLSVAENVLFAHGLPRRFPGRVDWGRCIGRSGVSCLRSLGVSDRPEGSGCGGCRSRTSKMVELAAAAGGGCEGAWLIWS